MRSTLRFAALHAALLGALWLSGTVIYALVFVRPAEPVWLAIDIALITALGLLVARSFDDLGIRAVTRRQLVGLAVFAAACVLASQLIVVDRHQISIDEQAYLATLRAGTLVRDGTLPFALRWLEPMLAGRLNVIAATDADALRALNFGALVVTGVYLTLLLARLGVARRLAWAAPVFLLASYLGVYAAMNRIVIDPFNYALFVVLAHALVKREHARLVPWILLVAVCNSEKALYWIPLLAVIERMRGATVRASLLAAVRGGAPAAIAFAAVALLMHGAPVDATGPFPEQVHRLAFTWLDPEFSDPVAQATPMQALWFPFGAFTIYALLGLAGVDRWLKGFALLVIPIVGQTLIAHDAERMTAYAFIVLLPIGALYLTRALAALPPRIATAMFALLLALAVAQHFLVPLAARLRSAGIPFAVVIAGHREGVLAALAAAELVIVGTLVWLHLALYAGERR